MVFVPPTKGAITKRGYTWILLIGAKRGPGKIRTSHALHQKERPADGAYDNPKRRISEVMNYRM